MHVITQLARLLDIKGVKEASELEKQIHYGAGPDLMELLAIQSIGRVRARKLYEAGFKSIPYLLDSAPEKVAALLGPKIAEKIFNQIERRKTVPEVMKIASIEKDFPYVQRKTNDH